MVTGDNGILKETKSAKKHKQKYTMRKVWNKNGIKRYNKSL